MAAVMALLGVFLLAGGFAVAGTASARTGGGQVCADLDSGKTDVGGEHTSLTVTAPEGMLIDEYCVKAGSAKQGEGPRYVTLDEPQESVTLTYQTGGKLRGISHYSLSYVAASSGGGSETPVTVTPSFAPLIAIVSVAVLASPSPSVSV